MHVYEALADVFVADKVRPCSGLMGDANMFWMAAMADRPGTRVIHPRSEGAAVAMADGLWGATSAS